MDGPCSRRKKSLEENRAQARRVIEGGGGDRRGTEKQVKTKIKEAKKKTPFLFNFYRLSWWGQRGKKKGMQEGGKSKMSRWM